MLIEIWSTIDADSLAELTGTLAEHDDVTAWPVRLGQRLFVVVSGDERLIRVPDVPAILRTWSTVDPGYRLVGREVGVAPASVRLGGSFVGGGAPFWVGAGPCALESYDDAIGIARRLARSGVDALRMGLFKPRSSPYHFQGKGRAGLALLADIRSEVGLPVVTEVLDPRDVGPVAEVADCLQVDTRNMTNRALLAELGTVDRPVLLMRGLRSSVTDWLRAAEFVISHGNPNIVLCARGVASFDDSLTFMPDYGAILAVRRVSDLPVIFDPSHSTGRSDAVAPAALAAATFGADGVLVETHHQPDRMYAPGDAAQMYDPERMTELRNACVACGTIAQRTTRTTIVPARPADTMPGMFVPFPVDRLPDEPFVSGHWLQPVPLRADGAQPPPRRLAAWTALFLALLRGHVDVGQLTLTGTCRADSRTPVPLYQFVVPAAASARDFVAAVEDVLSTPPTSRMSANPMGPLADRPDHGVVISLPAIGEACAVAEADLGILVSEEGCTLFASADLWHRDTAERLAKELGELCTAWSTGHAGSAAVDDDADSSVVELVRRRTRGMPAAMAVEQAGRHLTYAELDERSDAVAGRLVAEGLTAESIVALYVAPGLDLVVAMLGVLKAGGAFLPLDFRSPAHRLTEIVADSRAAFVLSHGPRDQLLDSLSTTCRVLAMKEIDLAAHQDGGALPAVHPAGMACVFYTSGTTSGPKGAMVTHRELASFATAMVDAFDLGETDRVLQLAPVGFDVLLEELLPTLIVGATVVFPTEPILETGADLTDFVARQRITGFELTAPYWQEWIAGLVRDERRIPDSLRFVAMGGERVLPDRVTEWRRFGIPLVHVYGLTEATVTSTYYRMEPGHRDQPRTPPLGHALPGVRIHILDDHMRQMPTNDVGELFVAGGLARGYVGRPGATAARFVPSPFGPSGSRIYRTGDLVRRSSAGALDYQGRSDQQIKVNGFRIEPAEVEVALTTHDAVEQCVTVVREDRPGDRRLVAYVVGAAGAIMPSVEELRAHVRELLPAYMVPSAVVALDALPLTSSGKFDRRSLPAPVYHAATSVRGGGDALQDGVRRLFADSLGLPSVDAADSFFDLGGHSLLAVRLLARLRSELSVDLSLRGLFQTPTVAGLCALARATRSAREDFDVLFPLREEGSRPPLFCVHPLTGLAWCYAALSMNLDPDIPVYGLQARGIATPAALPRSLTEMVDDYLEVITAVQPAGPYRLLGWSLGGTVAQAMAATLQRAGEEVSRLVLLDGYPAMTWAVDDEPGSAESYRDLLIAVLRDFGVDVDNPWAEGASTDELLKLASGHLGADTILDQDVLSAIVRAAERSVWVARQEQPRVFTGPVTSFTAEYSLDVGVRPVTLWGEHLTGPIDDHLVPSIHVQMASPQASSRVAEVLRTRL